MRDYTNFDLYLNNLDGDIYGSPADPGHTAWAVASADWAFEFLSARTVLDVGCGQGFCKTIFENQDVYWTGVTKGNDYAIAKENGLNVYDADMTFLPFPDNSFDVVFARHVLEHSPFPIITLMEWKRVARNHLFLVHPAPEYWGIFAKNHYSVYSQERLWHVLARAGWNIVHKNELATNHRLFLDYYRPEVTNAQQRADLQHPGAPIPVEHWLVCEQGEEKKE